MKGSRLRRQLEEANVFGFFFFFPMMAPNHVGRVTMEKRGRTMKVEGVDDSVTTWLLSQCLELRGKGGG